MTRLDEGLERDTVFVTLQRETKRRGKWGKERQQPICPPELMLYVYETERFPESESRRYTTDSNKKANRKSNCNNSIITFKPQPHNDAFVSGPDDNFT